MSRQLIVRGPGTGPASTVPGPPGPASTVPGPPGLKGDPGQDGSNVLPTDEAIANAVTAGGDTETALNAKIGALAALVPTIDETCNTAVISPDSITTKITTAVFVAPFQSKISQVSMVFSADTIAHSTNYWSVDLYRFRDGWQKLIAHKQTNSEGITAFTDWNFDHTGLGVNGVLIKGDSLLVALTPIGSPTPLVAPSITFRSPTTNDTSPPNPTVVVADTFTRANSTTTLGNAETGQAWTPLTGTWGVDTLRAHCVTTSGGADFAYVDSGIADCVIEVKIPVVESGASIGLCWRIQDIDNLFFINASAAFRRFAGAQISYGAPFSQTLAAGDTIRLVNDVHENTLYRQAGSVGSFEQIFYNADSHMATATKHGIRSSGVPGQTSYFDNFRILSL